MLLNNTSKTHYRPILPPRLRAQLRGTANKASIRQNGLSVRVVCRRFTHTHIQSHYPFLMRVVSFPGLVMGRLRSPRSKCKRATLSLIRQVVFGCQQQITHAGKGEGNGEAVGRYTIPCAGDKNGKEAFREVLAPAISCQFRLPYEAPVFE